MIRIVIAVLTLTLVPALASGLEWPKATKEGIQAREELLRTCVGEVALLAGRPPVCVGDLALLTDANRFRVAAASRPKLLSPALRDALVVWWGKEGPQALAPVLLEATGNRADDSVAHAYAAFLWGWEEERCLRWEAAVARFEVAASRFREAKDTTWEAACWHQIGLIYYSTGQSIAALEHYERALQLREKALPPGHPDIAASFNNIAIVHFARGDHAKALEYFERALRLWEKALPPGHPDIAASLTGMAAVHRARGDHAKALEYHERALRLREKALSPGHPDIADSLNNIGLVHHDRGDHPKALEYFERALRLRGKALPPGHPKIADSLGSIAIVHSACGDHAKALEYHERALWLYEKALPPRHPRIALSLDNIALVHSARGDHAKALEYHERALRLREKVLPPGHPDIAASLNNIANVHHDRGDHAKALEYHERALRLREKALPPGHPDIAQSLNDIGVVHWDCGDHAKALEHLERALRLREKALPPGHSKIADGLNNIANVHHDRGDHPKALEYFERALRLREKALPPGHPDIAAGLNNIAVVHRARGDDAKALEYFERALRLREKALPPGHPKIADSLNNIGTLHSARGDHAKALEYHERALRLKEKALPPGHPDIAQSLDNIAVVHRARGDHAKALEYFERALRLKEKGLPPGHPKIADSLNGIAAVHHERGDHAKALEYHDRALRLREKALPPGHPDIAQSLNNIALVHGDRGDHAKAMQYSAQALVSLRLPAPKNHDAPHHGGSAQHFRLHPVTLDAARQRAFALANSLSPSPDVANLRACVQACDLAADLQDRLRSENMERDDSRLQAGAEAADLLPMHLTLCQRLADLSGQPKDRHSTVVALERSRARIFADNLTRSRASLLAGADPSLRDRELNLTAKLRTLDQRTQKLLDHPGPDFAELLAGIDAERRHAEDDLLKLRAEIEQKAPRYAALKYPRPCSFADARACLAANEVAVYFAPGKAHSCAVVLEGKPAPGDPSQGVHVYPLPAADAFAAKVANLIHPETLALTETARELGGELYEMLLGPLSSRLKGKNLVIVPDGDLCLVPFELLIENDKYLIENHRIRYAPSLSVLHFDRQWEKARRAPDLPLFAVGDPLFSADDPRLKGAASVASATGSSHEVSGLREEVFARLVHSGREVKAVADLLHADEHDVLTGVDATLDKVLSRSRRLERARYVHLATHGVVGIADGQQPALVLGVGTDGTAPGGQRLRLDEVAGLRLNADLVVLSACKSGQGRLHGNEGVSGLARGFLASGSRGVVCSLWSVDDRQTARLMTTLYTRLAKGDSSSEALCIAKRSMIADGLPPLYWAPFILIGE